MRNALWYVCYKILKYGLVLKHLAAGLTILLEQAIVKMLNGAELLRAIKVCQKLAVI